MEAVLNSWQGRQVFVTGGTGLVGGWLIRELLKRGASVTALVRDADPQSELFRSGDVQRVSVISGAVEDYATLHRALNEGEIDTVFHLAAQSQVRAGYRAPLRTFETNIRGTYNLLHACLNCGDSVQRVVIASSDKAYGEAPELPYTEASPLNGRQPYEVSKVCADLLAQSYATTYGLPVAIARCGNIFGGGDLNWDRLVPGTLRSLIYGERPIIRSDGKSIRDYLYVENAVHAYLLLAEHLPEMIGEAFNFAQGESLTVLQMVLAIADRLGVRGVQPDIQNRAQGEIPDQTLDFSKATERLGYAPLWTVGAGIGKTVVAYREYFRGQTR